MKLMLPVIPVTLFVVVSPPAYSHGGGLVSGGCHTNSKIGNRHCHRGNSSSSNSPKSLVSGPFKLLSVGDGDTVRVTGKTGTKITIRLACIDVPETSQGASGKWSTQMLKGLLQGKSISIKPQVQDRYGLTVAQIYQGSTNINLKMVKLGAAFSLSQVPQAV